MSNLDPSSPELTKRQRFWLSHLEAYSQRGGSLRAYAREHGLSHAALYTAKSDLKRRGAWLGAGTSTSVAPAPKLLPVRITTPAPTAMFRVLLPNGTAVEVPEHADAERARALLLSVNALK